MYNVEVDLAIVCVQGHIQQLGTLCPTIEPIPCINDSVKLKYWRGGRWLYMFV